MTNSNLFILVRSLGKNGSENQKRRVRGLCHSGFDIPSSFVIRASSFFSQFLPFPLSVIALLLSSAVIPMRGEPPPLEYNRTVHAPSRLSATMTVTGQPIEYPRTGRPQVTMLLVEIPPGAETGWHKHPVPCCAYVLSGAVTVELKDGKSYTVKAGQAFAETVDTLHNGKNTGSGTVKILMTAIGELSTPVTVRPAAPGK